MSRMMLMMQTLFQKFSILLGNAVHLESDVQSGANKDTSQNPFLGDRGS